MTIPLFHVFVNLTFSVEFTWRGLVECHWCFSMSLYFVCRWSPHGRQYEQRQWAEGNSHTQMVHSTHQQCRWVELWCQFFSLQPISEVWFNFLFAELHYCTGAYRISPVDVNSRPSSCLTNFLLNGLCASLYKLSYYNISRFLINTFNKKIWIYK